MTFKLFVRIVGAIGVCHGIAFVLVPDLMDPVYGLDPWPSVVLVSRLFGAALVAWGWIIRQTRDFRDEAAIRSVLMATCIAAAVSLVFVVQATLVGMINAMGWVAALIYLFGAAGCACFLWGKKPLAAV